MNKDTKRKIWIGALATTGAVIFITSIFLIGRKQNMFNTSFNIYTCFTNVSGLKTGDYVRYSGVRAGIVDDMIFKNDSTIVVKMKIDVKLQPLIKKDAVAYITTEGLVGSKVLEIKPLWKSREAVKNNDTISSIEPFDTHEIIEKLLTTNDNVKVITGNLAKLTNDMNTRKSIFRSVMSDSVMADSFRDIIFNLKNSSEQFSQIAVHLKDVSNKISLNKGLMNILFNDTSLTKQIETTMDNLQKASANAASITDQLNASIEGKNKNAVNLLTKDTALANNLQQSIENLRQSSKKLNESMDALQHNFLLRGYFKERKSEQTQ